MKAHMDEQAPEAGSKYDRGVLRPWLRGPRWDKPRPWAPSLCCPLAAIRELRLRSPEGGFPRTIVVAAILLRVQPGTVGFDFARAKGR